MLGIIGYGAYIPKFRIKIDDIAKFYHKDANHIKKILMVNEKSVNDADEDTVTMSVEAVSNAIKMSDIENKRIRAVYSGSESHVYAVKPNSTIIGEYLGIHDYYSADLQFACKAGTACMQIIMALVKSNLIDCGLAIGTDTAQSKPGDILEYTASSGASAFLIGNDTSRILAEIKETYSYSSDIPDFWRRNSAKYPKHAGAFTGEPAYFFHITKSVKNFIAKNNLDLNDFEHVVFHMPNGKFPLKAIKMLGISPDKLKYSIPVVKNIGNTYSASSLLGVTNVLDNAKAGENILLCSFGSGAGCDVFRLVTMDVLEEKRNSVKKTEDYIKNKEYIDYLQYCRLKEIIL